MCAALCGWRTHCFSFTLHELYQPYMTWKQWFQAKYSLDFLSTDKTESWGILDLRHFFYLIHVEQPSLPF